MADRAAWRGFVDAVRADHATIGHYAGKYGGGARVSSRLLVDALRKVGFQMMVLVRAMQWARTAGLPLVPDVLSRFGRHLFAADIHPHARFDAGVMIVHGMGLCISGGAQVASGVILFQNVTLGEAIDPVTRIVGSPRVDRDVHIGPGATLLGPITVGAGSKIMAGCVVTRSVPPGSIVEAYAPAVRVREARRSRAAAG